LVCILASLPGHASLAHISREGTSHLHRILVGRLGLLDLPCGHANHGALDAPWELHTGFCCPPKWVLGEVIAMVSVVLVAACVS